MTTPDYSHQEMTYEEQYRYEHDGAANRDPNDNTFHEYRDENGNVVREYAMDAETITATPGAHVDWNTVVTAMVEKAEQRVGQQLPYTLSAVHQFNAHARQQIAQFVHDHTPDASIGWGPLVEGLVSGISLVFLPELEAAKYVFETAAKVFSEGLEVNLEYAANQCNEAKAKLEAGVDQLSVEVDARQRQAVDLLMPQLSPLIQQAMEEYRHQPLTMDTEWIEEMVTWFGFPRRDSATVTEPIVYELSQRFDQILGQVQAELAAHG
ncbi:MAG TPA: hypothetical protein VHC23_14255 [Jatrophihabitans sp.]|jgi:hypothetical protein|nr:hypothetical protein [Jatrophihabitans sp.]